MANGKWKCKGGRGLETHAKTTVRFGVACPHCGKPSPEGHTVSAGYDAEADDYDVTVAYSAVVPPLREEALPQVSIEFDGGKLPIKFVFPATVPEMPSASDELPIHWRCVGGKDDPHEPTLVQRSGREACRVCSRVIPDKRAPETTAIYSAAPSGVEFAQSVQSVGHNEADIPPYEIVPVEEAGANAGVSPVASVDPPVVANLETAPSGIELDPPPAAEPPPAASSMPTPTHTEPLPRVIVDPVVQAEALVHAANLAAERALKHVCSAREAANTAEAQARAAGSSAMRAGNRAATAEDAVQKCEELSTASADTVKDVAEIARNAHADAVRCEELQHFAHTSAEAADAHAQRAGAEAAGARDACKAAEKTASALERRKWTAWAWPVAFVLGCLAVFTLLISRIPSKSDVKVAVQEELGDRGLNPRLAKVSAEPHNAAVATAEPAPAQVPPVPEVPVPKVQEQEPPLVPTPVPPLAPVEPQPQVVDPVPQSAPVPPAPAPVAPAPAVVLAQPVPAPAQPQVQQSKPVHQAQTALSAPPVVVQPAPAIVANQAPVPVRQSANECEACVSKMSAPPFKFAARDARAGCAFLCGGR